MKRFEGRCAVISGASGAIGGAVARALTAEGCRCVLSGRSEGRLGALAGDLRETGHEPTIVAGDLTDESVCARLGDAAEALGGADILIHALGLFVGGALDTAAVADLDRQFAVNVRVPWMLTQSLLANLARNQGQVVFVNSSAGLTAAASVGAYAASKHALRAVADSFRAEVNPRGIRVLSVYPGRTASQMQEAVCEHFGQEYDSSLFMQPEDVGRTIVESLALARSAEITDVRMRPMIKT